MLDEIEQAVVELTNALRAEPGLAPLTVDMALSAAADSHSRDMADNDAFGHRGSDDAGVGAPVGAAGYDEVGVVEDTGGDHGTQVFAAPPEDLFGGAPPAALTPPAAATGRRRVGAGPSSPGRNRAAPRRRTG